MSKNTVLRVLDECHSLREFIYRRRRQLGMTQAELAAKIGALSPEFISLIESGTRSLDLDRIPRLAEALETEAEDLCQLALEEQYPHMYNSLFGSRKRTKTLRHSSRDGVVTQIASRLLNMPPEISRPIVEMINRFYDQTSMAKTA